jgi:hypothetical protein
MNVGPLGLFTGTRTRASMMRGLLSKTKAHRRSLGLSVSTSTAEINGQSYCFFLFALLAFLFEEAEICCYNSKY